MLDYLEVANNISVLNVNKESEDKHEYQNSDEGN
jgi:hypothetical protein